MTHLSTDKKRCKGRDAGPQGIHPAEECRDCLRRTAHRPRGMVWFMEPLPQPCPQRIPPEMMGN